MLMPRQFSMITHNYLRNPMPKPHQSLSIILLFSLISLVQLVVSNNNEVVALYSWLRNSPSFSSHFSNWNPSDPNPCTWYNITCSPDNFVTEINIVGIELAVPFPSNMSSFPRLQTLVISSANLTGPISPDTQYCSELVLIDVSANSLVGNIPPRLGRLKNLEELILNSNELTGEIPKELGDCPELRSLFLFDNFLTGRLPPELGRLSKLESLRVGGNKDLAGKIPAELGDCRSLKVLGLADTKISGDIPSTLGKLSNLRTLSIYTTMVSGEIPKELGNCSELVELFLYENDLSGSIPPELGKLTKLEKMLMWQNNLAGAIPEEIGHCKSLKIIDLSLNFFSGTIPESFGALLYLEELLLSNNNISGTIPSVLFNATSMVQLQLDTNQLSGTIPAEIGRLTRLEIFFAWQNSLEGSIPPELSNCRSLQALDLSHNDLSGNVPAGIFQIKNLTKLLLISNRISGSIPPEIGGCISLVRLRLSDNRIGGEIPPEIGLLKGMSFLDLSGNRLGGSVPKEIGDCDNLQLLNLSNNTIRGTLPNSLSSLTRLQVLDLSSNDFTGEIPLSLGDLSSLNRLVLSKNSLSGQIPATLSKLSSLQLLDLGRNNLSGQIPAEIFKIEDLEIALNLSHNALSGQIPPEISGLKKLSVLDISHNEMGGELLALAGLENLVSLNVSYNNFAGFLPDTKLFRRLSLADLEGNRLLCSTCFGSITTVSRAGARERTGLRAAMAILISLTVALVILGLLAAFRSTKRHVDADTDSELGGEGSSLPWQFTPFQKLNFTVEQVLKSLTEPNVIGKGVSGVVYRAELGSGETIAVKKLRPAVSVAAESRSRDSFSTEIKTLGSIRHKNIVRFLGCCWNKKTRLLMYDYMANGSLGRLLHDNNEGNCLNWEIRYKIVLGSAQGLAYLHHDCVPPIVHRDIKANNILIGDNFEPYIADFGLAKLVEDGDFGRSSSTIAGSYGYIAPEYGYMMKITEKSDVYSFGVVILEVLTGKQPIDPTIPNGLHIVDWVRQRRGLGPEVLDQTLRTRPESEIDEMLQTLGVAMLCLNPTPDDRPTMKDVAAMVKEIRQIERDQDHCTKVVDIVHKNVSSGSNTEQSTTGQMFRSNTSSFSASSLLYSSSSSNVK